MHPVHLVLRILGLAAAVYLTVNLVPGVAVVGGWTTIALVTVVWAVIITVIKPVLGILSLPINILTLGLFSLIVNALLFWGMELVVPGFDVAGFWPALFGSVVLSILSWLVDRIF